MRAVAYRTHGPAEVTELIPNFPFPQPKSGQLLIKVEATGLNPRDAKLRAYIIPTLIMPTPKIIATDFCGRIVSTEKSITKEFHEGDRVIGMMDFLFTQYGAAAEYAVVDEKLLARAPENLSSIQCAAIPLTSLTVYQALKSYLKHMQCDAVNQNYENVRGKRILIHAGAGGVGTFAIQYCKHVLGMFVMTTCSSKNVSFVKSIGADFVIDYTKTEFDCGEEGVGATDCDVVLDCMSYLYEKRTFCRDSKVLKLDGWYINIVSSSNRYDPKNADPLQLCIPEVRLDYLAQDYMKQGYSNIRSVFNYSIDSLSNFKNSVKQRIGVTVNTNNAKDENVESDVRNSTTTVRNNMHYLTHIVSSNGNDLRHVCQYYASGIISPILDRMYDMECGVDAMLYLEEGHTVGKNVMIIDKSIVKLRDADSTGGVHSADIPSIATSSSSASDKDTNLTSDTVDEPTTTSPFLNNDTKMKTETCAEPQTSEGESNVFVIDDDAEEDVKD